MKPRIINNSFGRHFGSVGPKRIRKPKKIFTPASVKKRTLNKVNLKKVRALKKRENNSRFRIDSDQENDEIESTRTDTVNALKNLVHSQNQQKTHNHICSSPVKSNESNSLQILESDVSCVGRVNHDFGKNLNSSDFEDDSQAGRHNDERLSCEANQATSLDQDTLNEERSHSHRSNDSDYDCDEDLNLLSGSSRNSQLDRDAIRQSLAPRKAISQAPSLDHETSPNERRSHSHRRLLYQSNDGDYDCDEDLNLPSESSRNSQLDRDPIRQSLVSRKAISQASRLDKETERGLRLPSPIQISDNNGGDDDLETLSRPDRERRMIRNPQILKNLQNNTYDFETPVRSNQERTPVNRPVDNAVEQPNTPRRSESFDDDYSMVEVEDDRYQMYGADYEHAEMMLLRDGIFCMKGTLRKIRAQCNTPNSVARYLMRGIFNPERVLNCTLTGRRVNNQGKDRQNQPMQAINDTAKDVIIKYTFAFAKKKRWSVPFIPDLNFAMSDELGKIKREQKRELERFDQ